MKQFKPILQFSTRTIRLGFVAFTLFSHISLAEAQNLETSKEASAPRTLVTGEMRSVNDSLTVAEGLQRTGTTDAVRRAIGIYRDAIREFHATGAFESEALSWHRISLAARQLNDLSLARDAASKARVVLFARLSSSSPISSVAAAQAARAYLALARIQLESSEVRDAFQSYEKALSLAQKAGLPRETAVTQVALGLLASRAEELDTATGLTLASIDSWRAAKDFSGEAMALNNLARFSERRGDLATAASYDRQAADIYRFSRDKGGEAGSLNEALRVNLLLSNFNDAARACEKLVGLSRANGNEKMEIDSLLSLSAIEVRRSNPGTAYRILLRALTASKTPDTETVSRIRELSSRFDELALKENPRMQQALQMSLADQEAASGRYSAAYQLLLRILVSDAQEPADQRNLTDQSIREALRRMERDRAAHSQKPPNGGQNQRAK